MKTKIKTLIHGSQAIKNSDKTLYSKLVDFLNEDQQKQLLIILENEIKSAEIIQKESASEKSQINASFISSIDDFFKYEQKKAMKSQEQAEKDDSENLLKELNDV